MDWLEGLIREDFVYAVINNAAGKYFPGVGRSNKGSLVVLMAQVVEIACKVEDAPYKAVILN